MQPCLEIVTYTVTVADKADTERAAARERAGALPGFAGWLPVSDGENGKERADLVVWTSASAAQSAAEIVGQGPAFAPFRATISAVGGVGHYALPTGGLPMMQPEDGVEIGRFRLRSGVSEASLREAHERMIAAHLSKQPGWRGQRLLRLQDGSWVDLALAASEPVAQAICASWAWQPECEAFLALIEPISMEFGSVA